jgi:hypothetical protein
MEFLGIIPGSVKATEASKSRLDRRKNKPIKENNLIPLKGAKKEKKNDHVKMIKNIDSPK